MSLSSAFLFAFLACFVRCTSMLVASPLFGNSIPVNIRVMVGLVLSLALTPVVQPFVTPPSSLLGIALFVGREAAAGLVIGGCTMMLLSTFQMAGSFLDLQMGLGSAQMFNPLLGATTTPISQFKSLLSVTLVLLLDGHHLMLTAFVQSYGLSPGLSSLPGMLEGTVALFSQLMLVALQIAAPVAGVSVLIDFAASLINKAVPQTQPFLISLPVKLGVGMLMLAVGLPGLVVMVRHGLDITFSAIPHVWSGR